MASDQAPARRGPLVRPRQSRQEFEQRLLGDLAASALEAGEARQPPARAQPQRLRLEGPVAREAVTQRQARQTRRTCRRRRLPAGTRRRGVCHRACLAGREGRRRAESPLVPSPVNADQPSEVSAATAAGTTRAGSRRHAARSCLPEGGAPASVLKALLIDSPFTQ